MRARLTQIALAAATAIALVQPAQAFAHPTVEFKAPVDGARVSGVVKDGSCEVSASSDTTTVDFYLDGQYFSPNRYAPWNCWFDSSTLSDGPHALRAVARDGRGDTSSTGVQINVSSAQPGSGSGEKATTRSVGSLPLEDAEAASRVTRRGYEPRPANYEANHRVPTASELATFRSTYSYTDYRIRHVTGDFRGTTDEIIQWAAHKWGIAEDVMRAVAVQESYWRQSTVGDGPARGGYSYSLYQVKNSAPGPYPLTKLSTAFAADYYGALFRYYYDGQGTWLRDPCCRTATYYEAGDLWGSVGVHFSGRWHNSSAELYIAGVKKHLASRVWEQANFRD